MSVPDRVLHVIGAMDRGGAETLVMNIYRAIDRDDVQFDFLVHDNRRCDYDEEIEELGGRIFHLFRFTGINLHAYKCACRRFFSEHHEYIAVHVHIGSSAAIIINEARRFGLYTIAHSHNTNPPLSIPEIGFRFFSFPTRFLADAFLACSEQAGADRFGKRACSRSSFHVLYNGIDTQAYTFDLAERKAVRSSLGFSDDEFVFGHVGRFSQEKNHALLLEAFSEVHAERDCARLVLVGRGPLECEIKHEVERLNLASCVLLLGIRDDIPSLLMGFDGFVFPSLWEGLGISAIEAQASGLPAVLSSSLPKMAFFDNEACRVDPSAGVEAWAESMRGLMDMRRGESERPYYAEMAAGAGFDIMKVSRQLVGLYKTHSFERW